MSDEEFRKKKEALGEYFGEEDKIQYNSSIYLPMRQIIIHKNEDKNFSNYKAYYLDREKYNEITKNSTNLKNLENYEYYFELPLIGNEIYIHFRNNTNNNNNNSKTTIKNGAELTHFGMFNSNNRINNKYFNERKINTKSFDELKIVVIDKTLTGKIKEIYEFSKKKLLEITNINENKNLENLKKSSEFIDHLNNHQILYNYEILCNLYVEVNKKLYEALTEKAKAAVNEKIDKYKQPTGGKARKTRSKKSRKIRVKKYRKSKQVRIKKFKKTNKNKKITKRFRKTNKSRKVRR